MTRCPDLPILCASVSLWWILPAPYPQHPLEVHAGDRSGVRIEGVARVHQRADLLARRRLGPEREQEAGAARRGRPEDLGQAAAGHAAGELVHLRDAGGDGPRLRAHSQPRGRDHSFDPGQDAPVDSRRREYAQRGHKIPRLCSGFRRAAQTPRKRLNLASWNRNGRERNYRVSGKGSFAFYSPNTDRILNLWRRVVKPLEEGAEARWNCGPRAFVIIRTSSPVALSSRG